MVKAQQETDRVIETVTGLAVPFLENQCMELVELEYRKERAGWILRLFIDKEGGITLDDCANVSREFSDLLEIKDPISHPYHLEISSPGLNRPLKKEKDFERFKGKKIKIKTAHPISDRKTFLGVLSEYRDDTIYLIQDNQTISIPYEEVTAANLQWEF
ncbi:MAG: ribosome maturation factor RimP [Pseudomonadota bacterium]